MLKVFLVVVLSCPIQYIVSGLDTTDSGDFVISTSLSVDEPESDSLESTVSSIDNTDSLDSFDNSGSLESLDDSSIGSTNSGDEDDDEGDDDDDDVSDDDDDESFATEDEDDDDDDDDDVDNVSNDGDDDINVDDEEEDEEDDCVGLPRDACQEQYSADGDQDCGYNAETEECYSIERRAGSYGSGNYDDGFLAAQEKQAAQNETLLAVVGVLGGIVGVLLMVTIGGGYYFYNKQNKQPAYSFDEPEEVVSANQAEDGVELIQAESTDAR